MNGQQTQFPVPCAAQGDKVKKSQEKLSPVRQEGWGKLFQDLFLFPIVMEKSTPSDKNCPLELLHEML